MGNKFIGLLRPSTERLLGLLLALALTIAVSLPTFRAAEPSFIEQATAVAMLPIAGALGWLLAPRAVSPNVRSWLGAALAFDVVAVVVGSFAVAGQAVLADGGGLGASVSGTIMAGLIGLVFLGNPMLAIGLVLALAWVGLLRLACRAAVVLRSTSA